MISSYYFLAQKRITGNWMPENEYELIKINSDSMESCDRWLTENYPKRDGYIIAMLRCIARIRGL